MIESVNKLPVQFLTTVTKEKKKTKNLPGSWFERAAMASLTPLIAWFFNCSPSSTYLKTSFNTKNPFSCGARKND